MKIELGKDQQWRGWTFIPENEDEEKILEVWKQNIYAYSSSVGKEVSFSFHNNVIDHLLSELKPYLSQKLRGYTNEKD